MQREEEEKLLTNKHKRTPGGGVPPLGRQDTLGVSGEECRVRSGKGEIHVKAAARCPRAAAE